MELNNIGFVGRASKRGGSLQISIPEEICEFCNIEDNSLLKIQILDVKPSKKTKKSKKEKSEK